MKKVLKRNILLTGGTSRIGEVLIREMVSEGHRVLFTTRGLENGESLIERNGLDKKTCIPVVSDFLDFSSPDSWVSSLPIEVDMIIHNARSRENIIGIKNGRPNLENWAIEWQLAVSIPYILTYALVDGGHSIKDVVFISSMYGIVAPNPYLYEDFQSQSPVHYGPCKAGQIHLVKELAVRLAPQKIRVNAISYGGVKGRVNKQFLEKYARLTPSARMLNDADLYPPLRFLINESEVNYTGQNMQIDGGWTIW